MHNNSQGIVNGILNLDKPRGWTSHDVVAQVRRLTRIRRVGHAGTLDPMATGVLLICLGRATRIAEYLMAGRKRYRAEMRLGVSTDSHDADGQVTARAPVKVDYPEVVEALSRFRGMIEQVPPMVSAIKRDGQPLYKLARQGITVERPARSVKIYKLELIDWSLPEKGDAGEPKLLVELSCSPGTYVRALARDLGQRLGCGAHLTALVRLASGDFDLDTAIDLEQFTAAVADDAWHGMVLPMDAGLTSFPACRLEALESRRVRSGQSLPDKLVTAPRDQLCRAYDAEGRLLGLLKFDADAGQWRPHKVFRPL